MLPKNIEEFLDAVDLQDSRDYIYEEEYMKDYGMGKQIGPIWDSLEMKLYNQFAQPKTYKACGSYSSGIIINGNNVAEYSREGFVYEQIDPQYRWYQLQALRGRPNRGSSLQEQLRFARDNKEIEGRMRATTTEGIKNAIDNGFLILTGTKDCDWRKAGAKGEFVYKKNGGGHMFPIVGYDDKGWIVPNSFGRQWGNNGYFTIPYEYEKYLFSTYVIIDHDDSGILNNLNYEREFKKAIELGITNGANPDKPATRKEVAVMNYRVYKMLKQ